MPANASFMKGTLNFLFNLCQIRTESDQPPTITAVPQLQRIEEPSRNSVGQFESAAEAGGPLRKQTPIEAAVVIPSLNCLQTAGPTSQPSPPPPIPSSTLRHQQSAALPSPVHSILSAQVSSQFEPARLVLLSKAMPCLRFKEVRF